VCGFHFLDALVVDGVTIIIIIITFIHGIYNYILETCGPGSAVGIATAYGLDGPGIESRWGEIFRTSPDRPCGPPSLL